MHLVPFFKAFLCMQSFLYMIATDHHQYDDLLLEFLYLVYGDDNRLIVWDPSIS